MAQRDEQRYVEFVVAHQDRLRRAAYLLTADWAGASDVTQEALVRVYVALPRLDLDRGVLAYARKAVVSAAIDARR